jgi:DNA-directed RNA polymerase specialized sigma24 family protein
MSGSVEKHHLRSRQLPSLDNQEPGVASGSAAHAKSIYAAPGCTMLERIDALGRSSSLSLLAKLPSDQAAAVRARVFEELPYEAIGTRLKCSPLVARKRVSRGLATLRTLVLEESE